MWKMIWPVLVVVLGNTFYNICQKSTPSEINPFCTLMITYLVAAFVTGIIFLCTVHGFSGAGEELRKLNWASLILGIAIIALELGMLYLYRVGWNISIGPFVCNTVLAVVLLIVGFVFYGESINVKQIIGLLICTGGLILITI